MDGSSRFGWFAAVAVALGGLTLAAPGAAKSPEAAFKLLSVSGTHTHTFREQSEACTGTQTLSVRYRTTKPTKMYVSLREAHGLHTLVSDKPNPDSGLDYLSAAGEMTLSRSVDYQAFEGCLLEPVECPETTFQSPVLVFGTHDPSAGISPAYDTNVNLPSGLDQECDPSFFAKPPDRDLVEFVGAIPRSEIFGKKKRLSGEDSYEFSYQAASEPDDPHLTTVTGSYGEGIAVELKRLKAKR